MQLVEIRDDIAAAKNLAAACYLASCGLAAGSERSALCELTNLTREKLEAVILAIDRAIASERICSGGGS